MAARPLVEGEARRADVPSRRRLAIWLSAIALGSSVLAMCAVVAPYAPLDPTESNAAALVAYAIGFAFVAALVLLVSALAPTDARTAAGAALAGAIVLIAVGASGAQAGAESAPPLSSAASSVLAALLALGTASGAAIGRRIQHAGHLSVVAVVSSVADLASVLSPAGPSHAIAESPALLSLLALSWPMMGTSRIEPLLGVGDVVMVALYLAAASHHGLSRPRSIAALAVSLSVTAVVVALTARAIPALPFLGAAILVAHPAARLPPPSERRKALIALGLFLVVTLALVLVRWSG